MIDSAVSVSHTLLAEHIFPSHTSDVSEVVLLVNNETIIMSSENASEIYTRMFKKRGHHYNLVVIRLRKI